METRSWGTSYRGPLAIHAAKGFPSEARHLCFTEPFLGDLREADLSPFRGTDILPRGRIIAVCRLVGCERTEGWPYRERLSAKEYGYGDYSPGRWAWLLDDVVRLSVPIPYRGALGLFDLSPDTDGLLGLQMPQVVPS